jgi:thiol-disulfide isomerase/thioredoxin
VIHLSQPGTLKLACLAFFRAFYQRSRFAALASLSLSLFLTACGDTGRPLSTSPGTPASQALPRTSLPMPPVTQSEEGSGLAFTLLDNSRMKLSDYSGKVVVLDFWATYCAPCLEEAPHLDALQRRFGAQGLQVIGLNAGGHEDYAKVPDFVAQLNIKYTLGIPDPEMQSFYMSGGAIPQTLVFDRTGRLIKHFTGYDKTISAELESVIEKAVISDE